MGISRDLPSSCPLAAARCLLKEAIFTDKRKIYRQVTNEVRK
jgi:hypothetical protein